MTDQEKPEPGVHLLKPLVWVVALGATSAFFLTYAGYAAGLVGELIIMAAESRWEEMSEFEKGSVAFGAGAGAIATLWVLTRPAYRSHTTFFQPFERA